MPAIKQCILCGKEPVTFGGHVHRKEGSNVIIGLCEDHKTHKSKRACKGCYGYLPKGTEVDENKF